jgi:dTDP-4-dehydrorhamnose 3,5-epimerase
MAEFCSTKLDGVILVKPRTAEDHRGTYTETYNKKVYVENGIAVEFVQDDFSRSRRNVLRGLHGDQKTYKLIDCMLGEFYLVVLNVINGSPQFGKWEGFHLSDRNRWQVLIPPRFANGHYALTDEVIFHYKQSEYYDPASQFSIRYDDFRFKIAWPFREGNPILSERDQKSQGPSWLPWLPDELLV